MASKAQVKRDKQAIRTVITQQGKCSFDTIQLHAGEGLSDALWEMIDSGEVVRTEVDGRPGEQVLFSLCEGEPVPSNLGAQLQQIIDNG